MRGISIVQGKVNLDAGLLASLIQKSGRYTYRVVELSNSVADLAFFEGDKQVGTSRFTKEDAAAAKLWDRETWKAYPRNMLFARALSNGQRWYCPALAFGSVYTGDELDQNAPAPVIKEVAPATAPTEQPKADAPVSAEFTESDGNGHEPEQKLPQRTEPTAGPTKGDMMATLRKLAIEWYGPAPEDKAGHKLQGHNKRECGVDSMGDMTLVQLSEQIAVYQARIAERKQGVTA
jgi:hypothetical protein